MAEEQKQPPYNKYMQCHRKENADGGKHLEVFLNDTVVDFWYYLELLQFLHEGTEKDTCNITIDNRGGYLVTGIAIAEAIKNSKAHVTTIAVSIAASAAALIWTAGHTKVSNPWGFIMYHTASYMAYGNAKQHEDKVTYINTLIANIMQEALQMGLITEQDVMDITSRARDIFVPGVLMNTRTKIEGIEQYSAIYSRKEVSNVNV